MLAVRRHLARRAGARSRRSRAICPASQVEAEAQRSYPHGELGAHTIGYLNEITAEELPTQQRADTPAIAPAIYVGRAGLERQWESFLRGKDGVERIIVDAAAARRARKRFPTSPRCSAPARVHAAAGRATISYHARSRHDAAWSTSALRKHKRRRRRRSRRGHRLHLAHGQRGRRWIPTSSTAACRASELDRAHRRSELRPLIDKTVRENYFPGSTFKIVPMLAALETGYDPHERVTCHGALQLRQPHLPLRRDARLDQPALGARASRATSTSTSSAIGSASTAWPSRGRSSASGEPPASASTARPRHRPHRRGLQEAAGAFQKGMTARHRHRAGLGEARRVLQVAMAYAAIANGGKLWVPQMVAARASGPTAKWCRSSRRACGESFAVVGRSTSAMVRRALYDAVNDPKGTSFAARVPGLEVAGKTGTAQVQERPASGARRATTTPTTPGSPASRPSSIRRSRSSCWSSTAASAPRRRRRRRWRSTRATSKRSRPRRARRAIAPTWWSRRRRAHADGLARGAGACVAGVALRSQFDWPLSATILVHHRHGPGEPLVGDARGAEGALHAAARLVRRRQRAVHRRRAVRLRASSSGSPTPSTAVMIVCSSRCSSAARR